jgi:CRP/FNR family cyclic AMP-dependent transcriptional regulator
MATGRNNPLQGVQLFADLSDHESKFLLDRALTKHFVPGQLIFAEGEACEGLYVIESGQVKIFKSSPNGREQILTIEPAGTSIAELPVFDGGNYPASAAALTAATLLYIRKKDLQTLCLEHPEVALKVLKVVGSRLRRLVEIIDELSFASVRHRLAALLLRLAKSESGKSVGAVTITLPSTNQELAAQIGTIRELVSRNLSRLQAMGIVHVKGRTMTIPHLEALEAEVEDSE